MNDDDPWDETPRCLSCGDQLGYLRDVVQLSMGELTIGRKSGLHFFSPMEAFPDGSPVKYIHMHCLLTLMDFVDARDTDISRCNLCSCDLTKEAEIYRLQIGRLVDTGDNPFWEFLPRSADQSSIYLCTDCMLEGLGEGDHDAGCVVLGMA